MSEQVPSNRDTVKYSNSVSSSLYFILCYRSLLRAVLIFLPLLGMTWIIGIFAINNETQVFAWIFAILNSLQVPAKYTAYYLLLYAHALLIFRVCSYLYFM